MPAWVVATNEIETETQLWKYLVRPEQTPAGGKPDLVVVKSYWDVGEMYAVIVCLETDDTDPNGFSDFRMKRSQLDKVVLDVA